MKLKQVLYYAVLVSLVFYIFSIPAFSGRAKLNIISYGLMAMLIGFTFVFVFLYRKFEINKLMIIPLLFIVLSILGTIFYSHEYRRWFTLLLMFLTMLTFYYSFIALDNKRLIVKIIIFSFIAFAIYFVIHYRNSIFDFKNIDLSFLRIGSDAYFDNVNTIGFYFSIAFSLSLYIGLIFKRKIELLYLISALLFFVLGLLTGSRAFIVVLAAGILCVLFFRFKKKKWIFFIVVGALIGLFVILINIPALSFLKEQFDRMLFTIFGIGNSKVDTSTMQRIIWPRYAWYLAGKNMIVGYGCNGFAIFSGVGTYSHNNYSEVACDFGIIGFVLFHLSFIIPLLYVFKPKDEDTYLVVVIIALYLVRNFFGVTYYSKDSYLVLGLCYYLIRDCKFLNINPVRLNKKEKKEFCEVSI